MVGLGLEVVMRIGVWLGEVYYYFCGSRARDRRWCEGCESVRGVEVVVGCGSAGVFGSMIPWFDVRRRRGSWSFWGITGISSLYYTMRLGTKEMGRGISLTLFTASLDFDVQFLLGEM
jgi:hypothetical protein